jgi:hypothetical protein
MLASLNPAPLAAFGYVGGATLIASILGWAVGLLAPWQALGFASPDALRVAQHCGFFAGYFASMVVLSVWLLRWVAL